MGPTFGFLGLMGVSCNSSSLPAWSRTKNDRLRTPMPEDPSGQGAGSGVTRVASGWMGLLNVVSLLGVEPSAIGFVNQSLQVRQDREELPARSERVASGYGAVCPRGRIRWGWVRGTVKQSAPAKGIEPSSPDRQSGRLARCVRGQLGQPWRAALRRRTRALVGSAPVFSSHEFSNSKAHVCADPRGAKSNRPTMSSGGAPESRTPIDRLRAGCSAIELVPRANAVAVARCVVVMWDRGMLGQTSPRARGVRARAAPNAKKPPGGSPRRLLASCDESARRP